MLNITIEGRNEMGEEVMQNYKLKDVILAGRNMNDEVASYAQTDSKDVYNSFIQLCYSMSKVWSDDLE